MNEPRPPRLTFVGCGDAFGSGGRFNTCFLVERAQSSFLIDCGASSMVAMRRLGVDPNSINTIFISHLHGDHFGGLPFFVLDGQFYSRRTNDLTVVGPPGMGQRLHDAMEVFFPGSAGALRKFRIDVREVAPGGALRVGDMDLKVVEVRHACGAPALALRIGFDGKTIAYSGDTEWTDALIDVGRDADVFIVEALSFEKRISQHLDYGSLRSNEARIQARRIILTHLGPEMLARLSEVRHEFASDGWAIGV